MAKCLLLVASIGVVAATEGGSVSSTTKVRLPGDAYSIPKEIRNEIPSAYPNRNKDLSTADLNQKRIEYLETQTSDFIDVRRYFERPVRTRRLRMENKEFYDFMRKDESYKTNPQKLSTPLDTPNIVSESSTSPSSTNTISKPSFRDEVKRKRISQESEGERRGKEQTRKLTRELLNTKPRKSKSSNENEKEKNIIADLYRDTWDSNESILGFVTSKFYTEFSKHIRRLASGKIGYEVHKNSALRRLLQPILQRKRMLNEPSDKTLNDASDSDAWNQRGLGHESRTMASFSYQSCMKNADCKGGDYYCMSCEKCKALSPSFTCTACANLPADGGVCKPIRYCGIFDDILGSGPCPIASGCTKTADCNQYGGSAGTAWQGLEEYCSDCTKCMDFKTSTNPNWSCKGCEAGGGGPAGICRVLSDCEQAGDSSSGSCPQVTGCLSHTECTDGSYCRDCSKCLERNDAAYCGNYACPTVKGGYCYNEISACAKNNDGIGGSCVAGNGCSAHAQCGSPNYYCMSCDKCEAYHDGLPEERKPFWNCDPCPSIFGGYCESVKWCLVGNDSIDGECPKFSGCDTKLDCDRNEFCLNYEVCIEELSADDCGSKPEKKGFCLTHNFCDSNRATDGNCNNGCNTDDDCNRGANSGEFCADYTECKLLRGTSYCGPTPPSEQLGVCLPQEHCERGLHSPLGGTCPDTSVYNWDLKELIHLNSTDEFAIVHQAFNVWQHPDTILYNTFHHTGENNANSMAAHTEYLVAQIHSDNLIEFRRDDHEKVMAWKVTDEGNTVKVEEFAKVELSCPSVELTVPKSPSLVYESRLTENLALANTAMAECACLAGNYPWSSKGVCPRGIIITVGSPAAAATTSTSNAPGGATTGVPAGVTLVNDPAKNPNSVWLDLDSFHMVQYVNLAEQVIVSDVPDLTLYTMERDLIDKEIMIMPNAGCPSVTTPETSPFHPDSKASLQNVKLTEYGNPLNQLPKIVGMQGKFCLVKPDIQACSMTAVYKYCLYSGGLGILYYEKDVAPADGERNEYVIAIRLWPEELGKTPTPAPGSNTTAATTSPSITVVQPIPAVFVSYLPPKIMQALTEPLMISIGWNIGGKEATNNHHVSEGGLRVLDMFQNGAQVAHHMVFGAITYVEPSELRDVLFVCAEPYSLDPTKNGGITGSSVPGAATNVFSNSFTATFDTEPDHTNLAQVRVFKTSNIRNSLPEYIPVKGSPRAACKNSIYRDYHAVEFKRGDRYFTTFVNHHTGNDMEVYDTTDLNYWILVKTVSAKWEDHNSGLGAVTTNHDGSIHLLTYWCATFQCEGSYGQELYLLDSSKPPMHALGDNGGQVSIDTLKQEWSTFMSIHSVLRIPIQPGSEGRDIACSAANICVVTMNYDGFIVYDVGSYDLDGYFRPPRKLGEHSSTFRQDELYTTNPGLLHWTGAQKVFASKVRPDRFYIEHTIVDQNKILNDGTTVITTRRHNKLHMVQANPSYHLPSKQDSDIYYALESADPIVMLELTIKKPYDEIRKQLGVPDGMSFLDHFQTTLRHGFASAVHIPGGYKRFAITAIYEMPDSVQVNLEILPDTFSPSPLTILNLLIRQKQNENSMLYQGVLAPIAKAFKFSGTYTVLGSPGSSDPAGENTDPALGNTGSGVQATGRNEYVVRADSGQLLGISVAFGISLLVMILVILLFAFERRKRAELQKQVEQLITTRRTRTEGERNGAITVVGRPTAGQNQVPPLDAHTALSIGSTTVSGIAGGTLRRADQGVVAGIPVSSVERERQGNRGDSNGSQRKEETEMTERPMPGVVQGSSIQQQQALTNGNLPNPTQQQALTNGNGFSGSIQTNNFVGGTMVLSQAQQQGSSQALALSPNPSRDLAVSRGVE